jgi:hypothetical protein
LALDIRYRQNEVIQAPYAHAGPGFGIAISGLSMRRP